MSHFEIVKVYDELLSLERTIERLKSLHGAYWATRGAFEAALSSSTPSEVTSEKGKGGSEEVFVRRVLEELTARRFRVALGFELSDTWTICIYRAEWNEDEQVRYLRLVAHHRSIECSLEGARLWREGLGVGGLALAKKDEIVIPDLDAPSTGTAFRLADSKPDDKLHYKSLFAVPIFVGATEIINR